MAFYRHHNIFHYRNLNIFLERYDVNFLINEWIIKYSSLSLSLSTFDEAVLVAGGEGGGVEGQVELFHPGDEDQLLHCLLYIRLVKTN